jgi:hypothetical protein
VGQQFDKYGNLIDVRGKNSYRLTVAIPGNPLPLELCRCESPATTAEVIRGLLTGENLTWNALTVEVHREL